MTKFSSNPILFKIEYLNRDRFDTATNVSAVLGSAFHYAMEVYGGGSDTLIPTNESEAIEYGLKAGADFIDKYNDGFIKFSKTIPHKQKLFELFTFIFTSYVQQMPYEQEKMIGVEQAIKETIDVEWRGKRLNLPVPLKGKIDRIEREDGKIKIKDYKTCYQYSDPEKIDGAKIIQAVVYYLLAYAYYGEEPYSVTFQEVKYTKNSDGSKQVREYEMVFAENDLYFDFFFRFYEDITRALNGEMVYVPNVQTLFDNEVSIIAYIHRLDIPEETAALMKKMKVQNITDLLKKEIHGAGNMRKLMKAVEEQFKEAKNIDYSKMETQEKIATKLLEHGMPLQFHSVVHGNTVDLYQFTPSIGIKMSKIATYAADVAQILGSSNVRILAPVPSTTFVGFEVPREDRQFNGSAPASDGLNVPVGTNTAGGIEYINITEAPHVLIAGTTGGGKSVTLRSIIQSIGSQADFWLADPKGVELNDLSAARYAEDPDDIRTMLEDAVMEMDKRYDAMKASGERKWSGRSIILVIDEFGDFILNNTEGRVMPNYDSWTRVRLKREFRKRWPKKKDTMDYSKGDFASELIADDMKKETKYMDLSGEDLVVKLAQKARAAGIHMIIATQSPRANIITGKIKANFPTRIALRTAGGVESRIILDQSGAEKLLGKGDALIMRSDSADLIRVQSFNV